MKEKNLMESSAAAQEENRVSIWAFSLIRWFKEHQRDLPWRKDNDPYHVWISEIMLQQTRIEAVIPYYERFMEHFPTVEALAKAPEEEVLKYWEGLGYYSRARNLHKAAKIILEKGSFPSTKEELRKLPGIGDYTAGAILAIAFSKDEVAVDGNVMRVVSRVELLEENVLEESARKKVTSLLMEGYPKGESSAFVEGLMELGETLCFPKEPNCEKCPLKGDCLAFKEGREKELPLRVKEQKRTVEDRQVLIVRDNMGRILLAKRPEHGVLKGLWELPNILKEETISGMIRSFQEAYALTLVPEQKIRETKHVFTHITWNLEVWTGSLKKSNIENIPENLIFEDEEQVMLPTAFKKLLQKERR